MELLAGVVGGLGLFIVGMWLLTENLKKLARRRRRRMAHRWTGNPFAALLWGTIGGGITQSMTALTFIVVGILRSRLTTMSGALARQEATAKPTLLALLAALPLLGCAGGIRPTGRRRKPPPSGAPGIGSSQPRPQATGFR